jgi:hypothetical protein
MADQTFQVNVDYLDIIDDEAGYFQSGQPKKIIQLQKGDEIPAGKLDDERQKELANTGAIIPQQKQDDSSGAQGPQGSQGAQGATGATSQPPAQGSQGAQGS